MPNERQGLEGAVQNVIADAKSLTKVISELGLVCMKSKVAFTEAARLARLVTLRTNVGKRSLTRGDAALREAMEKVPAVEGSGDEHPMTDWHTSVAEAVKSADAAHTASVQAATRCEEQAAHYDTLLEHFDEHASWSSRLEVDMHSLLKEIQQLEHARREAEKHMALEKLRYSLYQATKNQALLWDAFAEGMQKCEDDTTTFNPADCFVARSTVKTLDMNLDVASRFAAAAGGGAETR